MQESSSCLQIPDEYLRLQSLELKPEFLLGSGSGPGRIEMESSESVVLDEDRAEERGDGRGPVELNTEIGIWTIS